VIDLDLSSAGQLGHLAHLKHLGHLSALADLEEADIALEQYFGEDAEWREELQESMEEAHKAFEEAMKAVDVDAHLDTGFKHRPFVWHGLGDWRARAGKATQTFTVNPDGQIEVKLRKGDSEVIMVYEDEADLQKRNPEMYDKYTEVMDAEVEQ
jgi:hypothetical protein